MIRRLIERCLNKDPKQRLRDIGEARIVLSGPMEEPATAAITAPSRSRLGWVSWAVAGALALALIVAGVLLYNATRPTPLRPLIRVNIDVDDSTPLARVAYGNGTSGLSQSKH